MDKKYIRQRVEAWIDEEEMPVSGALKPLREFDGVYPDDPEESEAYWDFIHWHMTREHAVLMDVPLMEGQGGFCQVETDNANSFAFGSTDFQGMLPKFGKVQKEHYAVRKIYERVHDLAITHSCISNVDGKRNTYMRFKNLVEVNFLDWANWYGYKLKNLPQLKEGPGLSVAEEKLLKRKKDYLEKRAKNISRARKCKRIWEKYAEWE